MSNRGGFGTATATGRPGKSNRLASCLFGNCCSQTQVELTGQFVALATAAGIGVALTCINYYYFEYEGEDTDIGSWGSFFTTYGTLFAIISGMVLANVLERFQNLESVVEEELNAIESIRDMLVYLNLQPQDEKAFLQVLCDYLKAVADNEWQAMALQGESASRFGGPSPIVTMIDSDTNEELLAIHNHAAKLMHRKPDGGIAVNLIESLIIPLILELGKFRTHRLSLAEAQLPPRLKFLLLWMIFFLVIGFILMSVQNLYMNIFMTVAVSGAIQWLFTVISDLDHPFYGIWNVSRVQLDKLIDKFETAIIQQSSSE